MSKLHLNDMTFKELGNKIKELLKNLSLKDCAIILLLITSVIFFISSNYYKKKSLTPIVEYSTDSLSTYKNKLNEEYAAKEIFIQTIDQLKESNSNLAQEVKNLKDHPIVITNTVTEFSVDTILMRSGDIEKLDDNLFRLPFKSDQERFYKLEGAVYVNAVAKPDSFDVVIDNLVVRDSLTIDVIEKGKDILVIAKPSNPYVTVNKMSSVLIDPTSSKNISKYFNKRWSIGPYVGVGIDNHLNAGVSVGVSLQYSLFRF